MGLTESTTQADSFWDERKAFIRVPSWRQYNGRDTCAVYLIHIRYQRYEWFEWKRFSDIVSLHRHLRLEIPGFVGRFHRPSKRVFTFGFLPSPFFSL